tara:strand:- start:615 stop:815 length:201 start_codon:yes stop_codon:yes gene_type:complete
MANTVNWGKVYCNMVTNNSWGVDIAYTTNAINDLSTPTCWTTFTISADSTEFTADTTTITADVHFI